MINSQNINSQKSKYLFVAQNTQITQWSKLDDTTLFHDVKTYFQIPEYRYGEVLSNPGILFAISSRDDR